MSIFVFLLELLSSLLKLLIAILSPRLVPVAYRSRLNLTLRLLLPLDVCLWSEWALSLVLQLPFQLILLLAHLLFLLPLLVVFVQGAKSRQRIATSELAALGHGAIEGVTGTGGLFE